MRDHIPSDEEMISEKEIVEKAKTDISYFGVLFDRYYQRIYNFALKRTANPAVAQDITSETFFKALTHIHTFTWREISFSNWLYKIANNETYTYFRKNKKRVSLDTLMIHSQFDPASTDEIEQELIAVEETLKRHQDFLTIHKQLQELDLKYQEVLVLRYFEKKKTKDIAVILHKNEGTVKSLLSRGISKLQTLVVKAHAENTVKKNSHDTLMQPIPALDVIKIEKQYE
jgi:RNA polymerase sigma-70 factor, ECF subfamily